ncbi:MAG TPA: GLUG motif-containing protein, partial [Acinetobacter sp.]|nr:GLUG motif-containing protein [Acinetobacter sp.]
MNKIYKVIWNAQTGCWQAVSELAKGHCTSQSTVNESTQAVGFVKQISGLILFGLAVLPLSVHAAITNIELPTGAQINSGSAQISQNGNNLNIQQNSQNLSTNWNTFNIGQDSTVNFLQPNQSAVALNYVKDSNASQIMGRLNANGQVFLLNPNGVVFSKTAQVNVGGLVASTLNITESDIQNGKYTLKGDANSTATIENHGTIQTLQGGTVALIAPNVKNTGTIRTPNGVTHLTSASQVTLALQDGSLTQYQVDQGVLQGLVDNGGAIIADNGAVYLTAKAKDSLSKAVVNHSGIIEANRLTQNAKGEIILLGDMQNGETNVSGTLKAEGKNGQDGGFIETSAANVKIKQSTTVSTQADGGKTGTWLIDPTDFSISSGSATQTTSGIGATTLQNNLATSNVTLTTSATNTGSQKGDINVNADVTWSSVNSLTLSAHNDININANITATNGKLNLIYGQNTANTNANYYLNNGAKVNLSAGQNFSTKKGTEAVKNYTVITSLGVEGSNTGTDLQGINGNLSGNYVLGADIDASSTWQWNGYTGFDPIGFYDSTKSPMDPTQSAFSGQFDGLGHAINGLTIASMYEGIGLFAITNQNALIQNVGLNNIDYSGYGKTGGLVGINLGTINHASVNTGKVTGNTDIFGGLVGWNFIFGNILNSSANVTVTGKYANNNNIGGLVGYSDGKIDASFATGAVTGNNYIGGLVGGSSGQISNSYATGTVIGTQAVGGLVGFNGGSVANNYASGIVTGTTLVGGLVGDGNGTVTNSFWNTETTGQSSSSGGGTGLTTAQMFDKNNFAGFDFSSVWGNGDNQTTPYLLNLANNQVFNKNDLPVGTITSANRPALYTAILNAIQLQNMNQNLSGKYLLGNDIDASDTKNWNNGAGFKPIGYLDSIQLFSGKLDGLGHTISDLYINTGTEWNAALINGVNDPNVVIRNIGLINASIDGSTSVGGLVGALRQGTIENSFTTGKIYGTGQGIGGLVGFLGNSGTIKNSYSDASVSGAAASQAIGGLVGRFAETAPKIINSYSSGKVTGGISQIGGLVGNNASSAGAVTNSFWNTTTSGQATSAGGIGKTTAEMQNLSTFTGAGWDIDSVGGTGKVWRIYDGLTAPLLRNFLTSLTITNDDTTTMYNGMNQGGGYQVVPAGTVYDPNLILSLQKNATPSAVTIDLSKDLYSVQQGYDLIVQSGSGTGTLTINKAILNAITGITAKNKTYDGTRDAELDYSQASIVGTIYGSDQVSIAQTTGEFSDKNAGTGKTVNI